MRFAVLLMACAAAGDVPMRPMLPAASCTETVLAAAPGGERSAHWTRALTPVAMTNPGTHARADVRLYGPDGAIDDGARAEFERVAASADVVPHALAARLEQLVVKAAYHFGKGRGEAAEPAKVVVVSGFRVNAGRHGTGDALDFKLEGVRAPLLAAYLRDLARVGVGIYTHPRTQFVHLDVRDASFHWIDGSPPGRHWREAMLRDKGGQKRDAAWTPEMDLPE